VDPALGTGGGLVTPDRVDQVRAGDHPVRPEGEHAEHGLLPGLPEGKLPVCASWDAPPRGHRAATAHPQRHPGRSAPFADPAVHLHRRSALRAIMFRDPRSDFGPATLVPLTLIRYRTLSTVQNERLPHIKTVL